MSSDRTASRVWTRRELLRNGVAATVSGWLLPGAWQRAWGDDGQRVAGLPEGKSLIVRSADPLNAEPSLAELNASWITPASRFFVRSHGTMPKIDADSLRISVEGLVERPLRLSPADLSRDFAQTEIPVTLTCAGNRRSEFNAVRKVGGVQWDAGAIGNAHWSGCRLADVLKQAGLRDGAKHVWFESLDEIREGGKTFAFGASVPLDRVFGEAVEKTPALLATRMNGEPLPREHGYPVRGVVPGCIGARSVKWLGKIVVSDRPSPNHYVADVYKILTDESQAPQLEPIYENALNSVIADPPADRKVKPGPLKVSGFALPSGAPGALIDRVELSIDGGRTWTPAKLLEPRRLACWQRWEGTVDVASTTRAVSVRATDAAGRTQPQAMPWNFKGYLFNGWHSVSLTVEG